MMTTPPVQSHHRNPKLKHHVKQRKQQQTPKAATASHKQPSHSNKKRKHSDSRSAASTSIPPPPRPPKKAKASTSPAANADADGDGDGDGDEEKKDASPSQPEIPNPLVYLEFGLGKDKVSMGKVVIELYRDTTPLTAENFRSLCQGDHKTEQGTRLSYRNCPIHRIVPGHVIQSGDITKGDGSGGVSIYGPTFADENFIKKHTGPGLVGMSNHGSNTNNSQFYITLKKGRSRWLDGSHVIVGRIQYGMDLIRRIEMLGDAARGIPKEDITIINCGRVKKKELNRLIAEAQQVDQVKREKLSQPNHICPQCNSTLKYVKRIPKRGVRFKCKNTQCTYATYLTDHTQTDAITTPSSQQQETSASGATSETHAASSQTTSVKSKPRTTSTPAPISSTPTSTSAPAKRKHEKQPQQQQQPKSANSHRKHKKHQSSSATTAAL